MTQTKHTPNPWNVKPRADAKAFNIYSKQTRQCVCTINVSLSQGKEEKTANAHLIAAAPNLAEELEGTIERLEELLGHYKHELKAYPNGNITQNDVDDLQYQINQIRGTLINAGVL